MTDSEDKYGQEKVRKELKEALEDKLVMRREAPLIGAVFFAIALWGSKIFTSTSPGTSLIFYDVTLFGYSFGDIHFHHFHYGIIAIGIAIVLGFIEGAWPRRIKHVLFGAGFGFIVDEYFMLLIMDDSSEVYFGPESQLISNLIGIICTVVYVVIALLAYYFTKKERELWRKMYDAVASGKAKFDI